MIVSDNYMYRVEFITEILANREQEYIRKGKKEDFEYVSEFDDVDYENALRWINDVKISFYAKDDDELKRRINFEFHNARIDIVPMLEDGYFYWFANNCLVEQQRMLHRGKIYVSRSADVEITNDDLIEISHKIVKNNQRNN